MSGPHNRLDFTKSNATPIKVDKSDDLGYDLEHNNHILNRHKNAQQPAVNGNNVMVSALCAHGLDQ